VGAARVGGDGAAELGLLGRAGVGREEQPALPRAPRDRLGGHPGFGLHPPQAGVEGADRRQALERDDDDVGIQRRRASGEAAGPTQGDHGHVVVVAPGHHRGDLLGAARAHERPRVADAGGVADAHVALDVLDADDGGQVGQARSVPRLLAAASGSHLPQLAAESEAT
jgi:hypothetical protein